jgi:hypothetical protein
MPLAGASPAIYQNTTLSDLGDSRLVLLIFWTLVHELSTASLLALGLIGLAATRRRSNYSSPSPAWSANASAGGGARQDQRSAASHSVSADRSERQLQRVCLVASSIEGRDHPWVKVVGRILGNETHNE